MREIVRGQPVKEICALCRLTAEGVEPLVALLKKAKISELSLQMNDLKDDGIIKVCHSPSRPYHSTSPPSHCPLFLLSYGH